MSEHRIDVSIVIVNYNTRDLLRQCLDSIFRSPPELSFETIVVDNASGDGSAAAVRGEFPQVRLLELAENCGFSRGNNAGIRVARGRYLLLLNSDTVVLPEALDRLARFLDERGDIATVGPMLLNGDGSLQRSWFNFPTIFKTFCHVTGLTGPVTWVAGLPGLRHLLEKAGRPAFLVREPVAPMAVDYLLLACLMIRREVLERIGLLDERLFFYHEDCELGYRVRESGLVGYYLPEARIVHLGGSSAGKYPLMTYREYFRSLVYVFGRHEGEARTLLLRIAIVAGMLIRSVFWLAGGYRGIRKVGTYRTGGKKNPGAPKIPARELLQTYLQIAADASGVTAHIPAKRPD